MTRSIRYGTLWYWIHDTRYRLKFVLTGDCGHACDWIHPFGWVPEDGCPVHLREKKRKPTTTTATDDYTVLWER